MKFFLKNLDEAVQRTPAAKQKIKAIQVEFEEAFGDRLYSKKFEYDVVESDLKKIFMIANKHLFKEKLNVNNVIFTVMSYKRKDKGTFKAGKDASQKDLIGIVKYDKDNFFQIVNVVLHEMIHLYDSKFGPLKDVINIAYVDNINNRQYVDRYDVHGKYFKDWCKKLNYFGFEVKETYSINDKKLMKKIIKVMLAVFVLSMVPTVQVAAQIGHIETPKERKAREAREAAAKKKKQQEAAAKKKREEEARKKREAETAAQRQREEDARKKKWRFQYNFSEGLAVVEDDNFKYGLIDKTGQGVIPCKWETAGPIKEGLAYVEDDNLRYGFIERTGQVVIPCEWYKADDFSEGLAWVQDGNRKWGVIDKTGKLVIPCKWKWAGGFSDGLALVMDDNGKYGFIDKTGKVVLPCKWKWTGGFSEGLAAVKDDNGKCGYINKTGNVVIPCKWNNARRFSGGLAEVQDDNGVWHKIDKTGKIVE